MKSFRFVPIEINYDSCTEMAADEMGRDVHVETRHKVNEMYRQGEYVLDCEDVSDFLKSFLKSCGIFFSSFSFLVSIYDHHVGGNSRPRFGSKLINLCFLIFQKFEVSIRNSRWKVCIGKLIVF